MKFAHEVYGALLFALAATATPVPAAGLQAIADVNVVDVEQGVVREHQNVVWDRSRIVAVGPAGQVTIPTDALITQGSGRYLMPGLMDMHVHVRTSLAADRLALPLFIANGVTGIRDMGESLNPDEPHTSELATKRRWSDEAIAGVRVGPRLLGATGFTLNGPSMVKKRVPAFFGTATAEEARQVLHYLKDKRGADFIKVYSGIPRDSYFALMAEARRVRIDVVGHKPMQVSFIEAADTGQRSIEHAREIVLDAFPGAAELRRGMTDRNLSPKQLQNILAAQDAQMLEEILAAMVRNETYYCPTHVTRRFDARAGDPAFVSDTRLGFVHPSMRSSWQADIERTRARAGGAEGWRIYDEFLRKGLQITGAAARAGVNILAGTDAGDSYSFYGSSLHDELEMLVDAGLTAAEALRAATLTPARFLKRSNELGTIEVGKLADMVLLEANPLLDIRNTRRIANVVFNGRNSGRATLDGLMQDAKEGAGQVTQPERFTLDQAIDAYESAIGAWASYATETVTAPNGRYVVWNERTELWSAIAPDFEPRQLTKHGDGAEIVDLYAVPDGTSVFYVRQRDGGEGELWQANTETAAIAKLASGANVPRSTPTFAPDGRSFVVNEQGTIMQVSITPTGLVRARLFDKDDRHENSTSFGEFAFSRDGRRLAFVSQRAAGQSYVGVLDLRSRAVSYLDPSIYRDSKPAWSLDGKELAFIRVAGNWVREHRFIDKSNAVPWSIQVWTAESGRLRTAWRADAGRGSYVPPKLFAPTWTRDRRLVFAWEKTGWPSLYAVSADGGVASLLTPGEGEPGRPRVNVTSDAIVFESNHGDLGRSHVWRLSLEDGRFEQLTRGDSVEQLPGLLSTGDIVYFASERGRMPLQRIVRRADGSTRVLSPLAADATKHSAVWREFVDTSVFTVTADDGVTGYYLLMKPSDPPPREGFPVIVICKGGPISRVLPGDRYGDFTPFAQYAVSRGYMVVFMNYRGSAGLGLDYRYPARRGATGGSELLDLSALARHLKSDARVNAEAIGIMGYSYGGHLVGLALDKLPQDYRAGVHMSGIGDWVVELKKDGDAMPDFVALSERLRADDLAELSSPDLKQWRAPVLFTIGDADRSGHVEAVIDLGYRLLAKGVNAEFQLIPGATHGDLRSFPMARVYEFFERNLRVRATE